MTKGDKQFLEKMISEQISKVEIRRLKAMERIDFAELQIVDIKKRRSLVQGHDAEAVTVIQLKNAQSTIDLAARERDKYSCQREVLEELRTLFTQKGLI